MSTKGQAMRGYSIEDQERQIIKSYPGAEIIMESVSGSGSRIKFDSLMNKLIEGDILVVTTLIRFCRSTREGLEQIEYLQSKGVSLHILNMGLIDNTPVGKLITTCIFAYAEFERSLILERTQRGKSIARENPQFKEGRPQKFKEIHLTQAIELLDNHTYKDVVKMTGISKSTLIREKKRREIN